MDQRTILFQFPRMYFFLKILLFLSLPLSKMSTHRLYKMFELVQLRLLDLLCHCQTTVSNCYASPQPSFISRLPVPFEITIANRICLSMQYVIQRNHQSKGEPQRRIRGSKGKHCYTLNLRGDKKNWS